MRRQKWLSQLRQQTLRFKSKRPVCTVLTGRRESLNEHVHFHVCVVDGVLEEGAGNHASPPGIPGVIFHPASAIDEVVVQEVQATLRRRILRAFVGRGLLQSFEAKAMLSYKHRGFSVDTSVRIQSHDRARGAVAALLRASCVFDGATAQSGQYSGDCGRSCCTGQRSIDV